MALNYNSKEQKGLKKQNSLKFFNFLGLTFFLTVFNKINVLHHIYLNFKKEKFDIHFVKLISRMKLYIVIFTFKLFSRQIVI